MNRRTNFGRLVDAEAWFFERILRDEAMGCWLWMGARDARGYGRILSDGRRVVAHRWAYELFVGPVPLGLTLDHLCRVHPCVNPAHVEAVSQRENVLRGLSPFAAAAVATHCIHGHEFTPENTTTNGQGRRECRACRLLINERKRQRRRVPRPHPSAAKQEGGASTPPSRDSAAL